MAENGQNEQNLPEPIGVLGPARPNGYGTRADLRIIQRAVENGWEVPPEWMQQLPKIAAQIAGNSKDERNRLRALEVLKGLAKDRFDAALALNDIYRHDRLTDDIARRIADDIRNRPPVAPAPTPGAVPARNGNGKVQGHTGGATERKDDDR